MIMFIPKDVIVAFYYSVGFCTTVFGIGVLFFDLTIAALLIVGGIVMFAIGNSIAKDSSFF